MVHSDGKKILFLGIAYDVFFFKEQKFSSFMARTSSTVQERQREKDRGK